MASRVRTSLVWLARALPTALVLAGLGALAWWGARNDWQLPSLAALRGRKEEKKEKKEEPEDEGPLRPGLVSLSSETTAAQAGIETAPARRETLQREVTAPAVVAFDQRRYAHLSARAAGTAWRVLVQAGDSVK